MDACSVFLYFLGGETACEKKPTLAGACAIQCKLFYVVRVPGHRGGLSQYQLHFSHRKFAHFGCMFRLLGRICSRAWSRSNLTSRANLTSRVASRGGRKLITSRATSGHARVGTCRSTFIEALAACPPAAAAALWPFKMPPKRTNQKSYVALFACPGARCTCAHARFHACAPARSHPLCFPPLPPAARPLLRRDCHGVFRNAK